MQLKIEKIILTRDIRKERNLPVEDNNTDVLVTMENGELYIASFFSYDSIMKLEEKNKINGLFLNGHFFWAKNMILVKTCEKQIIQEVTNFLIAEQDFLDVFQRLN